MEEFIINAIKKLCTSAVYSWASLANSTNSTAAHIRVSTLVNEEANEATISVSFRRDLPMERELCMMKLSQLVPKLLLAKNDFSQTDVTCLLPTTEGTFVIRDKPSLISPTERQFETYEEKSFSPIRPLVSLKLFHIPSDMSSIKTSISLLCQQFCFANPQLHIDVVHTNSQETSELNFFFACPEDALQNTLVYDDIQRNLTSPSFGTCQVSASCKHYDSPQELELLGGSHIQTLLFLNRAPLFSGEIQDSLISIVEKIPWDSFGVTPTGTVTKNKGNAAFWPMTASPGLATISIVIEINSKISKKILIEKITETLPKQILKTMRDLKTRNQALFRTKKEQKKQALMEQCLPEIAKSMSEILSRSTNEHFKNAALSKLGINRVEDAPSRLLQLMQNANQQNKKKKRKNYDVEE